MLTSIQNTTLYAYVSSCVENPRISMREFHKKYSHYKNRAATTQLIESAIQMEIIQGPFLFCNRGFTVDIFKDDRCQADLLDEAEDDPKTTYAMALSGDYSFLRIFRGASTLKYTETIFPSYPAKKTIEEISFDQAGCLPEDLYPHCWDERDWTVYERMRIPQISFREAAKGTGMTWRTFRSTYQKILRDCKILMSFLPLGSSGYQHQLVTFKTKYEIGVREALKSLDRSTYLYKFDDTIMLVLFVENYNKSTKIFREFKETGLIHSFRVSIPTEYYSSLL